VAAVADGCVTIFVKDIISRIKKGFVIMNKTEWCTTYFGSEMPDCLPVPERREVSGGEWATVSIPADPGSKAEELAAGVLLLLGEYGGLTEAGFLVWNGAGWQPLRQEWKLDMEPAALKEALRLKIPPVGLWRNSFWENIYQEGRLPEKLLHVHISPLCQLLAH